MIILLTATVAAAAVVMVVAARGFHSNGQGRINGANVIPPRILQNERRRRNEISALSLYL